MTRKTHSGVTQECAGLWNNSIACSQPMPLVWAVFCSALDIAPLAVYSWIHYRLSEIFRMTHILQSNLSNG